VKEDCPLTLLQDENKTHKVLDNFSNLYLNTRFIGKPDDMEMVRKIGKKISKEIAIQCRAIELNK